MSRNGFSRIGYSILAGSLAVGTAAMAQNQPASGSLPDAQIEANVRRTNELLTIIGSPFLEKVVASPCAPIWHSRACEGRIVGNP